MLNIFLALKASIATKVVCFTRLLKCLRSLSGKQCGPRSDCSYRSSLFWVHTVYFSNVRQLFAAEDFSRQHFQMHFFLCALRVRLWNGIILILQSTCLERTWDVRVLIWCYAFHSENREYLAWPSIGLEINKKIGCKIVNIFLSISFSICFGCSKESSHWDDSFEYPQQTFWLRNKKIIFFNFALLSNGLA